MIRTRIAGILPNNDMVELVVPKEGPICPQTQAEMTKYGLTGALRNVNALQSALERLGAVQIQFTVEHI